MADLTINMRLLVSNLLEWAQSQGGLKSPMDIGPLESSQRRDNVKIIFQRFLAQSPVAETTMASIVRWTHMDRLPEDYNDEDSNTEKEIIDITIRGEGPQFDQTCKYLEGLKE